MEELKFRAPREGKRKKLNLEDYMKEFKEGLTEENAKIKYCKVEMCRIKTKEGKRVFKKGQMDPQALIRDTVKHLENLKERGIIRKLSSTYRKPVRALRKPDDGMRLVINLIALNNIVDKDDYRLSNIRDVVRATQGAKVMSVVDLKDGFYSIEITKEGKYKTAFEFNGQVYKWNSMVMGYKNEPQILQRIMDNIFRDFRGKGVEIYMDDIVIYSGSVEEHDVLFREVLKRLKNNNMKLNPKKIQFCEKGVKQLGFTLNGVDITPSEIKRMKS